MVVIMRRMKTVLFLLIMMLTFCNMAASFTIPNFISNNMVWQRNKINCVVGSSTPGYRVNMTVFTNSTNVPVYRRNFGYSAIAGSDGTWRVCVPTAVYSFYTFNPFSINISDAINRTTISNVIYGEVILCSGQSNMHAVTVSNNFDASLYVNEPKSDFSIRLYYTRNNNATVPLENTLGPMAWTDVATDTRQTYKVFSALCYIFGRELFKSAGVPVGLIESASSGTAIEAWIDTPAWKTCNYTDPRLGLQPLQGGLYNGMIHPFRNFSIAGFLWYQGEANAGRNNWYECASRVQVTDWRNKWKDQKLFFGLVQLTARYDVVNYPDFRYAQIAGLQNVPYVYHTSGNDAGDPNSTLGIAHSRNKTILAHRLFKQIAPVFFNYSVYPTAGPKVESCCYTNTSSSFTYYLTFNSESKLFQMDPPFCRSCCRTFWPFDVVGTKDGKYSLYGQRIYNVSSVTYTCNQAKVTFPALDPGYQPEAIRLNWQAYPECVIYGGPDLIIADPFNISCSSVCSAIPRPSCFPTSPPTPTISPTPSPTGLPTPSRPPTATPTPTIPPTPTPVPTRPPTPPKPPTTSPTTH